MQKVTFLSLWSHANLHTDEDVRAGRGSAKEFADVLVVFGNEVIVFSDKHVNFQDDKDLSVAWARWYKRAVANSVRQLLGAMNWARRFPDRIFLDSQCRRPLPVKMPSMDVARFHLIAVTRGSYAACEKYFPGSLGTLVVNTEIVGDSQHEANPFTIGIVAPGKPFIHVFDDYALEILMGELDTASDFVNYLVKRQALLTSGETKVIAAGEEQLVAAYLVNGNTSSHDFLSNAQKAKRYDSVTFDESHFPGLRAHPAYQAKKRLDEPSYVWDEIVERFIRIGDPDLAAPGFRQDNQETERALRLIASESRFRRRILVRTLRELLHSAAGTGLRRARLFTTKQDLTVVYIFLVVPRAPEEPYDEYRQHRVAVLHAYCRCAKLRYPDGINFIGLATDHPDKSYEGASEDLFIFIADAFDDQARADAEEMSKELGILRDKRNFQYSTSNEYPDVTSGIDDTPAKSLPNKRRQESTKRNRKRAAHASQRRNRRK